MLRKLLIWFFSTLICVIAVQISPFPEQSSMSPEQIFQQLLAQKVLMIGPSPEQQLASSELEKSPLGGPARFDRLITDRDWEEMRSAALKRGPCGFPNM